MRRTTLAASLGLALVGAAIAAPSAQARDIPSNSSNDPVDRAVAAADQAIADGHGALRSGPGEAFDRSEVVQVGQPGRTFYHVGYEREYRGVPAVDGGVTVVVDDAGNVVHRSGPEPTPAVSTTPTLTPERAAGIAGDSAGDGAGEGKAEPRLVVLVEDGRSHLAWESVVRGTKDGRPSVLHVFVDAHDGTVVRSYDEVRAGTGTGFYNGEEEIDTSGSGGSFELVDPNRNGLQCGEEFGGPFSGPDDTWGNGEGTDLETACVDAMYAGQRQGDALSNWMAYDGVDGSGGYFPANVGLDAVNAFWDGSSASFGHSQDGQRQATPIDVVAHEFGHGVFQFAGTDGTGGGNEQGGMNESTGDIMGAIAEHYAANQDDNASDDPPDYEVGEEVGLINAGEPIRYMHDPSVLDDPNCYPDLTPDTEVHAGAGPQNHWFYLLAEGSSPANGPESPICSGGPNEVVGIGIQKAAAIFMSALATKNPSTWNHETARAETLAAAQRLYDTCAEFDAVQTAWDAIQVPAGSGETCS